MFKPQGLDVREFLFRCGIRVKDSASGIDLYDGIGVALREGSEPVCSSLSTCIPGMLGEELNVQQAAADQDEEPPFERLIGRYDRVLGNQLGQEPVRKQDPQPSKEQI